MERRKFRGLLLRDIVSLFQTVFVDVAVVVVAGGQVSRTGGGGGIRSLDMPPRASGSGVPAGVNSLFRSRAGLKRRFRGVIFLAAMTAGCESGIFPEQSVLFRDSGIVQLDIRGLWRARFGERFGLLLGRFASSDVIIFVDDADGVSDDDDDDDPLDLVTLPATGEMERGVESDIDRDLVRTGEQLLPSLLILLLFSRSFGQFFDLI